MSIKVEGDGLEKAAKMLEGIPDGFETAMSRALNRALTSGRAAATKAATQEYTLKANAVRKTMKLGRASRKNLEAELKSTGARLPLSVYAHKPTNDTTGANRAQVRAGIRKGGLKPVDQGFIHKRQVFVRTGPTSYPVEMQFGPAVPSILDNEKVSDAVVETLSNSVDKRLEHETLRILEGKG